MVVISKGGASFWWYIVMHDCTSLWWYLVMVVRYLVMVVLCYDGTSLRWYLVMKVLRNGCT